MVILKQILVIIASVVITVNILAHIFFFKNFFVVEHFQGRGRETRMRSPVDWSPASEVTSSWPVPVWLLVPPPPNVSERTLDVLSSLGVVAICLQKTET